MATVEVAWPAADNRIPREVFIDPELYDLELQRLFRGPAWFLVAHESEIPRVGDYKRWTIGDMPIVIVRTGEDDVTVLLNSCAHRTTEVVTATRGNAQSFTCIYHYWTYHMDGSLKSCPLQEDFPADFDRARYSMAQLRVARRGGCVFASFSDDAPPLDEYLGELSTTLDTVLGPDLEYIGSHKYELDCNWKLYVENIYDGYHATILHRAFQLTKSRGTGVITQPGFGHHISRVLTKDNLEQIANVLRDPSTLQTLTKRETHADISGGADGFLGHLIVAWPTTVVHDVADSLGIRYIRPVSAGRSFVEMAYFARKSDTPDERAQRIRQSSNLYGPEGMVALEDTAVCERIQAGSRTRGEHVVVKGTAREHPPYRSIDEANIRAFYKAYRATMDL